MNNFQIGTKLGEGAYGTVYAALDLRDESPVAIKKYFRNFYTAEEAWSGTPELELMEELDHPNVVQTKEVIFDKDSRTLYAIMECGTETLAELID